MLPPTLPREAATRSATGISSMITPVVMSSFCDANTCSKGAAQRLSFSASGTSPVALLRSDRALDISERAVRRPRWCPTPVADPGAPGEVPDSSVGAWSGPRDQPTRGESDAERVRAKQAMEGIARRGGRPPAHRGRPPITLPD